MVQIWTVFGTVYHVVFQVSSETGFLDMYLTTVVRVRNVENTLAMRVVFSLQIFKISSTFVKCQKKVVIFVQTV